MSNSVRLRLMSFFGCPLRVIFCRAAHVIDHANYLFRLCSLWSALLFFFFFFLLLFFLLFLLLRSRPPSSFSPASIVWPLRAGFGIPLPLFLLFFLPCSTTPQS
ncbi:hypothetical protein IWX49DRAFT_304635 [Phyllosticta citricarpa]|uniref:Uncharacterized protein n=1 Tax=Phyllosticta paracitricarpa TaxID=2016321 RepID=A0ABR1N478_9PEZI